jgi:hypothetical protein
VAIQYVHISLLKFHKLLTFSKVYLVAGALTVLWSFVIFFFMPPDPIRVKGFSERQRYIAVARLRSNNAGVRNTHFKLAQALEVFIDPRAWIVFSMAFLISKSFSKLHMIDACRCRHTASYHECRRRLPHVHVCMRQPCAICSPTHAPFATL